MQLFFISSPGTAEKVEQGFIDRNEVANLRHELNNASCTYSLCQQRRQIGRQDNAGSAAMPNHSVRSVKSECAIVLDGPRTRIGIDALDDGNPVLTDMRQNADGAQQS